MTDNGPQFVSDDFERFLKANGIRHIRTASYHPASNGQAERFVQSFNELEEDHDYHPVLVLSVSPLYAAVTDGKRLCIYFH